MKLALFGHGYIGSHIAAELSEHGIDFAWLRHSGAAGPNLREFSAVINAAGYTGDPNVDACEENKMLCLDGNVSWPLRLELAAGNTPVVHIGSGCLYQGGPFSEDDPPNFSGSFYSCSKGAAEQVLRPYLSKSYILRVRMPFGSAPHPKNLLTKLLGYPRLVNSTNSMTCVEDLARVAVWFAVNLPPPGIYNVVNPGCLSTTAVISIMGVEKSWFSSQEEFLQTVRVPRSFCALKTDKIEALSGVPAMASVDDAIARAWQAYTR